MKEIKFAPLLIMAISGIFYNSAIVLGPIFQGKLLGAAVNLTHINSIVKDDFIQEIFNGIRTIKIYGMENQFISSFQKPLKENLKAAHKTGTLDSIFPCLM